LDLNAREKYDIIDMLGWHFFERVARPGGAELFIGKSGKV
jgi:hypothetical protein